MMSVHHYLIVPIIVKSNLLYIKSISLLAQDLTQVEEMLISAVLPIMSLYKLPHGQYAFSGHIINPPQDVASFVTSLPRLLMLSL